MPFLRAFLPLFLEAGGDGGGLASALTTFVPLLGIVAVMYFLMIRPENKRKKQIATMRSELMIGDEITTIGGIVGTIVSIKDDVLTLETGSDRTKIQITRWSISTKGTQTTESTR